MSEKEQFYKLHGASLEMFKKKRSLVNCFLDDQGGCFPILEHLDHLPNLRQSSFKLHYFQGTTFCILAETKLSIQTQHLHEHMRSRSRHFKLTVGALHLENCRYKKQCSCLNDLTLLMSRTILSASSSFSC